MSMMRMIAAPSSRLLVCIWSFSVIVTVSGFVAPNQRLSSTPTTSISASQRLDLHRQQSFRSTTSSVTSLHVSFSSPFNKQPSNNRFDNNKNNKSERKSFVENARRSLERLIGPPLLCDQQSVFTPPALTPLGRKHRQLEIRLLQSLRHSDGAIDELVALWKEASAIEASVETSDEDDELLVRSHAAVTALEWMENQCDRRHAEVTLRAMMTDCPTWTEPAARLALLLYYEGKYAESYKYNQLVLRLKPWHFEALQLQVLLFLVSSDRAGAIWAARCGLPPLNQTRKRTAWIEKAVALATDQLVALEEEHARQLQQKQLTRMMSIGPNQHNHHHSSSRTMSPRTYFSDAHAYTQDDAWQ